MSDIENPYQTPTDQTRIVEVTNAPAMNRTNQTVLAVLAVAMFSIAFAYYGTVESVSTIACCFVGAASLLSIPFCKRR